MDKKYSLLDWTGILLPEIKALAKRTAEKVPTDSVLRTTAATRVIGILSDSIKRRGRGRDVTVTAATRNISRFMRLMGAELNDKSTVPIEPPGNQKASGSAVDSEIEMLGLQLVGILEMSADVIVAKHPETVNAIAAARKMNYGEEAIVSSFSDWIDEAISEAQTKSRAGASNQEINKSIMLVFLRSMVAVKLMLSASMHSPASVKA